MSRICRPARPGLPRLAGCFRRVRVGLSAGLIAQAAYADRAFAQATVLPFYDGWTADYTGTEPHTLLLWKFDEPDPGLDASGNNQGVIFPSPGTQTGVAGKFGQSFLSEGPRTTANSHYARSSSNNPTFPTNALSVEFWFKPLSENPTDGAGLSYFLDKRYTDAAGIQLVLVNEPDTVNGLRVVVGNGSVLASLTTDSLDWDFTRWTHLAVTYETSQGDGTLKIYRDGKLLATNTIAGFGSLGTSTRFYRIANRLGSIYGSVPGFYDNFRVSDVAYSYAEAPAVFPIGGYAPDPARDKANGFTLAGPVNNSTRDAVLTAAASVGMPGIYRVGPSSLPELTDLDGDAQIGQADEQLYIQQIVPGLVADVRDEVATVLAGANAPTISAWYLVPEELRWWKPREMHYLNAAFQAIRAADPKKRPVWMYEPNHRAAASLGRTVWYQNLLGKGMYANYVGRKNERAWISWTLGQVKAAIAAPTPSPDPQPAPDANPSIVMPIAVLEMFQAPPQAEHTLIPAWVRHDCYASLVSGARAIVIYSFSHYANLPAYYSAYAGVAGELNGPAHLGAVFLQGQEAALPDLTSSPSNPMTILSAGTSPAEPTEVPALLTRAMTWRDGIYLFAVNSSANTITLHLHELNTWEPLLTNQPNLQVSVSPPLQYVSLPAWGVAAFRRPINP